MALPSGCVAHWQFNEGTGTTLGDWVGGHVGTLTNMEAGDWAAGKINYGLTFDGVDEYVETVDLQSFCRNNCLSISLWAYAAAWPVGGEDFLGYLLDTGGADHELYIATYGPKTLTAKAECEPDGTNASITAAGALTDGQWAHIVVVANGTTGYLSMYCNAVLLVSEKEFSGAMPSFATGTKKMDIGAVRTEAGHGGYFAGTLDNIMLFNRALSADDVKILYHNGHGNELVASLDQPRPASRRGYEAISARRARYDQR